jgi:hypothetical protein
LVSRFVNAASPTVFATDAVAYAKPGSVQGAAHSVV